MFEKIIIPLDGSKTAQAALPAAAGLAAVFESEVELVHVLGDPTDETSTQVDPLLWHMRKAEIESYLSTVAQIFSRQKVRATRTILEGEAADRIIAHAAAQDIDLIVLSSHGSSGLSGWNVSSVAHKILARANRSVLLVRAFQHQEAARQPEKPLFFNRILVPLDGSRRAECVLPVVNQLAEAYDAAISLVHVFTPATVDLPFGSGSEEAPSHTKIRELYKQAATDYLEQKKALMTGDVNTVLLQGDAVIGALSQYAQRESIDLMVLSAHGRSCSRKAYGSVVTSAIVHDGTSLLIVQDLAPSEIEPTHAQIAANQQTSDNSPRTNHHAQPAFWTP